MRRRDFLKMLGIGAGTVGAAGLATPLRADDIHHAPAPAPVGQQQVDWNEMNEHHRMGIETFLDNIGKDPLFWDNVLEPTIEDGVKVFHLTCEDILWETEAGVQLPAMAFNGHVPGPAIHVDEGDQVRVVVTNNMVQPTAVHWHGLVLPNGMDGVPFITQEPINSGETFTYEFTARNPGTHMYHSHLNAMEQVTKGLLGAIIIHPQDTSREPEVQGDYLLVLNDASLGFTLNGKSFPYTQPIIANLGDKIRIRYFNEGIMIHPMHLHGMPQLVFAKDGYHLPTPFLCDTLNIAPGERYDVLVDCTEPGTWAFHCHILNHAEGPDGMFGMVTVLIVNE